MSDMPCVPHVFSLFAFSSVFSVLEEDVPEAQKMSETEKMPRVIESIDQAT